MVVKYLFLVVSVVTYVASSTVEDSTNSTNNFVSGLKLAYNTYQQCEDETDTFACLKLKALKFVHRALKSDSVPVLDGIKLVKTEEGGGRALTEAQFEIDESKLPQDPEKKQEKLDELLVDHVGRFFQTHTVQLEMPRFLTETVESFESSEEETSGESEGRRRRKKNKGKMGMALLMGLMAKGGLMTMAYSGVAAIAAKAIMVAKIALVLAAVVGLSSLGGGGGGKTTYEIVKHPHVTHDHTYSSSHAHDHEHYGGGDVHYETTAGGHGWGRNLDSALYPQLRAYSGQLQRNNDARI